MYNFKTKILGKYDVVVCGGGIMDAKSKGGMIKELMMFLHERELILTHNGLSLDENGKKFPSKMYDIEYTNYFFEKVLKEAGVKILYNSIVCGVEPTDGHIN